MVIRGVIVVGMHHHGPRSLGIDEKLRVKREHKNKFDSNACAVTTIDSGRVLAYLKRDSAKTISSIIDNNIPEGSIFIKAKYEPEVRSRRIGPQQHCYVAFLISANRKEEVEAFMKERGILFHYHKK